MEYIARTFYSYGKIISLDEVLNKIQVITPEDIQEISPRLFKDKLGIAVLGKNGRKIGENLWEILKSKLKD